MDAAIRRDRSLALRAAIVGSCLLHAVLIGLALRHLGETPVFAVAPVMRVELVPWRTDRPPPPSKRPARADTARAPSRPEALTRPPTPESPVASPILPPGDLAPGVRRALRGLMGCDRQGVARLTAQEREACADRLADGRKDPETRLDLDPRARFAESSEPYLARKPKNGCKVRAAGDPGLLDKDGARAALSCAWDF